MNIIFYVFFRSDIVITFLLPQYGSQTACCYLIFLSCFWIFILFYDYYYFSLSGLSDAVVESWLVKHQIIIFFVCFSNAEAVVTDVALVMDFIFLFLFCVADCCAEKRILGVFLIFFTVTADILSIIDLWHGARKLFYSVFFSLIFIYWSFVHFFSFGLFYFHVYCFILEGKQDSIERRTSLSLAFYFGDRKCHINVKSIKTNVKIETTAE